jgi:hypothetical protein
MESAKLLIDITDVDNLAKKKPSMGTMGGHMLGLLL